MATKRRKKKKSPLRSPFYWILFVFILACLLGIRFGAAYLTDRLEEYEVMRPKYAVAEAVKVFENKDFDSIQDSNTTIAEYSDEDKEGYKQFINDLVADRKVECKEVYSLNKDEMLFSIMADDEKLGNFKMVHTGETSEHGYPYWKMGEVTLIDVPQSEYFITVPSDSTVTADGKQLGEADILEKDIVDTRADGYLPKKAVTYTYTKYHYITRFGKGEFQVTDKYGKNQALETVSEVEYKCDLAYNSDLRKKYGKKVLGIAENIALYSTADVSVYAALGNVQGKSPAEEIIQGMDTRWAVPHSGHKFANETVDQFLEYSSDVFSCHVTFDYILNTSEGKRTYPTAYTMYFRKTDNGYKLYNFAMH